MWQKLSASCSFLFLSSLFALHHLRSPYIVSTTNYEVLAFYSTTISSTVIQTVNIIILAHSGCHQVQLIFTIPVVVPIFFSSHLSSLVTHRAFWVTHTLLTLASFVNSAEYSRFGVCIYQSMIVHHSKVWCCCISSWIPLALIAY
jgi:hypothetical protein